jgi:N-acetyl-1-D-myo-inositol-2-amino-2-deoxy-alpha-D-glucopyranoside deacetylase
MPHPVITRVLAPLGALGVGVFIGAVVTVHHRSLPPFGLILGLVLVAAWAIALRVLAHTRTLALFGVLGVFVAQMMLSAGVGGSFVVVAEPLGYGLTLGVVIVSLLVLAWPKLPSPSRYDGAWPTREGTRK